MALEPINSMMTAQTTLTNPVSTAKTAMEYTDVSIADSAPKVDNTTKVVENAEGKSPESFQEAFQEQIEPSKESLHKAVEEINKKMANSEAVFGFHDETNRVTIKIVDKDTKKVIKELPPEKTLDMIARVWEMAGILVDEKR